MPDYTVTHPTTGKTITISGEAPPTEAELDRIFAATAKQATNTPAGYKEVTAPLPGQPDQEPPSIAEEMNASGEKWTPQQLKGAIELRKAAEARGVVDGVPEWARQHPNAYAGASVLADFAKPVIEGGGTVGGGILGAGAGPVAGVAGAGLGYAAGKNLTGYIDTLLGREAPQTAGEATGNALKDFATGATMDMGGQLLGKGIGAGLSRFAKVKAEGLPFTDKRAQTKAAQIWEDLASDSPIAAEANAARQGDAEKLLQRVGTGAKPTPGQASGNLRVAGFEQSAAAKDPALMERLKYNDAQLAGDAQKNMLKALGPARPPLPVTPPNPQGVGVGIDTALEAAKQPVVAAERAAWDAVPNYTMPSANFEQAAAELAKAPMVKSTADAITGHNGVLHFAKQMPRTVQGLQSIDRTISSEIGKAMRAGDNETARALGILKSSIGADFDAMSAAAANGDIAVLNGKIVFPSQIQAELDAVKRQIAFPQGGMSPVKAEADALVKKVSDLEASLAGLQPAEDVAQAYTAAKRLSKVEKFDRFDRGAVKDVLAKGDEMSGRRLPAEAVPAQFFTPTGASDLVRALTPMEAAGVTAAQVQAAGMKAAGDQMLPHVMDQLTGARIIGQDGIMDIPRAMAWVRQNKETLKTLGLDGRMMQMVKEQIPGAVKATLERAADKGVDVLGNPTMTARQSAKLWRDFAPAWRAAGGDPKALQAMRDYHTLITMLNRNKGVSYAGNSTSIEKLFGDAPVGSLGRKLFDNLSSTIIGGATGATVGGPVGAAIGGTAGLAAKAAYTTAAEHSAQAVRTLLKDAITNPETAQMLIKIAKGAKVPATEINRHLGTLGIYATKAALSDPLGIRQ